MFLENCRFQISWFQYLDCRIEWGSSAYILASFWAADVNWIIVSYGVPAVKKVAQELLSWEELAVLSVINCWNNFVMYGVRSSRGCKFTLILALTNSSVNRSALWSFSSELQLSDRHFRMCVMLVTFTVSKVPELLVTIVQKMKIWIHVWGVD